MPSLGADMSAGMLVAWRKKPGDAVKRGDIIAEVETDKGLIDVEVYVSGVVERVLVAPGTTVPTGTVLAIIREEAGAAPAPVPVVTPPTVVAVRPPPSPAISPAVPSAAGRLRISPLARKLAADLGIDPARVRGTGPGGAIRREDIEHAAAAGAESRSRTEPDRQARIRQAIGAAMARSKREIPHYYVATTIDAQRAMTWLAEENLRRSVADRFLSGVVLIKAVALALREVPELNSVWRGGEAVRSPGIHVGVAISLRGGGLVAPALHDTDRQSLDDLMRGFRDLVRRARSGGLEELRALGSYHHGHKPGRAGGGERLRRDLSAPGGDRRIRQDRGAPLVGGGPGRVASRGHGHALRRPPRERRSSRRALPRRHRSPAPGAGTAMTRDELRATVLRVLGEIAPEADLASLEPDVAFRDQLDLDSMDNLNFVIGLHAALGVEIPEADYPKLATLERCLDYLKAQVL